MKRFIVTEDEKRSIRQMYLLEGGDDTISTTSNVSAPVFGFIVTPEAVVKGVAPLNPPL